MYDEKDLGKDLESGKNTIIIEGDLAKKVFKIKATEPVAWGICIAAIAIAVAMILAGTVTGGVSAVAAAPVMAAPMTILGAGVATSAVAIAVAAGNVNVLNKLRDYDLEKISDTKVILHKK